ncbi:Delta(8)-fatty-acid desaturase [Grifola frondosa]|uniref:Delta(8)-fatty-acid desaturase n=1 Tax=Grifola frondosa TaxID=5627 RepID=A0A1C7MQW8_GRIFR|nr:Delta(8)-fatty-acid desaturase [Grifola frondosa]
MPVSTKRVISLDMDLKYAISLGLFWHQLTFFAHDLGHMGVTHNWAIDRLVAIFVADFLGGMSIGWWVDNHNIHHLVTNHPSHDPDIQHLPFFAVSPVFLKSLWSSLARFNLYANSYGFLAKTAFQPKRFKGDVGGGGRRTWSNILVYLLLSHIAASPVHVQIVLSHFSRSTADVGPVESFAARQLRTTVDVICPPSLAFIHGGLHLQVTHHLFPRLPRHNLLEASMLVKEFAKEQGLEFAEFGFIEGNGEVRGVLKQVADQVKIVGMVANAEINDAMKD